MLTLFIAALVLGLIFNAAPGAVFAESVRRSLRGGFRSAFAVQIGSLTGDAIWALLGLAGIGVLFQLDALRLPIGIAGALYMTWLAWTSWREATQPPRAAAHRADARSGSALRAGVMLSITNPQNIGYWAALGSALSAVGVTEPAPIHYGVFFGGFMTASVVWAFVCARIVVTVFGRAEGAWARLTHRACAVAFLLLALASLHNLWRVGQPGNGDSGLGANTPAAIQPTTPAP